MRKMNLRQQPRISYCEPEEPSWDAYIFCDKCGDYAYEYCSVHGPLLVIPDDMVPAKSPYPPYVPSAALTIPHVFLHIAPSIIPGAGLGIFSTLTLPRGVRFGPYKGTKTTDIKSTYCWQIYDNDHRPSHVIDAADPNKSNWMRYVNCARHWSEQNLVAYQYNGQLYYRTVKLIPRFTELMVFYGSEFASMMGINLSTYNLPISYNKSGPANKTSKQCLPKSAVTAAPSTLPEDINDKGNKSIVGNKDVPENYNFSCHQFQNKRVENNDLIKNLPKDPGEKSYICDLCEYRCSQKIHLNRHKKFKHTKEKNFSCHICQYKCVTKSNLNRHHHKHTGEKPYICDLCEYRCSDQGYLNKHKKYKHTKEKNFSCHICQYKCVTKNALNIHLRKHTGEKPYICDLCEYRCSQKIHLNRHKKFKHTKEKNFSCHICQYKCVTKSALNRHHRKHTGEKPYICDLCEYRCSQKIDLNRHKKYKHTKEKNFSCHICQYKCVTKSALNIHLRKHTGEKPYICDLCEYRCSQKISLNSHKKYKHTKEKNS